MVRRTAERNDANYANPILTTTNPANLPPYVAEQIDLYRLLPVVHSKSTTLDNCDGVMMAIGSVALLAI